MERLDVTAVILTGNEALHIARCLERVRDWCARVIVVDSFSTDGTVEIARGLGAEVHQHAFLNQAAQFQWTLDTIPIDTAWTLRLDADEYCEPALVRTLQQELPLLPDQVTGLAFYRKMIFRGRWIRHGTYYPVRLLRMWRTGTARIEQRWMDEHARLLAGEERLLRGGDLVDENLSTIGAWTDKHNRYATRHMVDFVGRKYGLIPTEPPPIHRAARVKRFLRERVFGGAPLYLRTVLYFLYRYFLRLGFLDGRQGFVWHTLHGFWLFMLIDAKIDEAETVIAREGVEAFPTWVAERYGMRDMLPDAR